jgi:hypothetical protein
MVGGWPPEFPQHQYKLHTNVPTHEVHQARKSKLPSRGAAILRNGYFKEQWYQPPPELPPYPILVCFYVR